MPQADPDGLELADCFTYEHSTMLASTSSPRALGASMIRPLAVPRRPISTAASYFRLNPQSRTRLANASFLTAFLFSIFSVSYLSGNQAGMPCPARPNGTGQRADADSREFLRGTAVAVEEPNTRDAAPHDKREHSERRLATQHPAEQTSSSPAHAPSTASAVAEGRKEGQPPAEPLPDGGYQPLSAKLATLVANLRRS